MVAGLGLVWFGFVLETALVIQGCFSYSWEAYTESRPSLLRTPAQGAGSEHRTVTPTDPRDVPHSIGSCSAGGSRKAGHSEWWRLSIQVSYLWWIPASLEMAEYLPVMMGSEEWILCVALLLYVLQCQAKPVTALLFGDFLSQCTPYIILQVQSSQLAIYFISPSWKLAKQGILLL